MIYLLSYFGMGVLRIVNAPFSYAVLLILLFVFSAFRYEVGCDWTGYLNQYHVFATTPFSALLNIQEPLWVGWIAFQNYLGLPYPWLNVFSSAIFFAGVHALAKRQRDPLGFLILLFPILIINMPMSGIRQGAAIGVICYAFIAFEQKKLLKFVIITGLATSLHSSALIFILLVPLVAGHFSRTRILLAVLLALPGIAVILTSSSGGLAIGRYVGSGAEASGAIFRIGLIFLTSVFYFIFLQKVWKRYSPETFKLVNIGAIMMCVSILVVPISSVIADRVGYYLLPLQAMIFANAPYMLTGKVRILLWPGVFVVLFAVLAIWTTFSTLFHQCYLPYGNWLFSL